MVEQRREQKEDDCRGREGEAVEMIEDFKFRAKRPRHVLRGG